MVFIKINNKLFFVKKNISILEACKFVGIIIPRFCFHETLGVAGNCRMCLVEIEPNINLKPVSACTLVITEDIHVLTNTPFVLKARENILETLLLNHPLDCPICDQGGECDLQDQTLVYGIKSSRYFFSKRPVEDKNISFFIKTIMTRCIHCTRCVRFSEELIGSKDLGTLNRGQKTEIGTYTQKLLTSNISGNIIDLCPVGALTSRIYAFKARPWELKTNETIDLTDANGSPIFVDVKEAHVVRILPKKAGSKNDAFISDKARFSIDALAHLRILSSFKKEKLTWQALNTMSIFGLLRCKINVRFNLFLISGDLEFQSLHQLTNLLFSSGNKIRVCTIDETYNYKNFYLNTVSTSQRLLKLSASTYYIFSSNLLFENVLINLKIRMNFLKWPVKIFSAGFCYSTNYENRFLTFSIDSLTNIFEAKNFFACNIIKDFIPFFIFGISFQELNYKFNFDSFLKKNFPNCILFNLKKAANSEGLQFFNVRGINTNLVHKSKTFFLFSIQESLILAKTLAVVKQKALNQVFWINSHNAAISKHADFIIPIFSVFEKDGLFLNMFGQAQHAYKSVINYNRAILNLDFVISFFKGHYLAVEKKQLASSFFFFFEMASCNFKNGFNLVQYTDLFSIEINFFQKMPIKPIFENYYQTNSFTKNSLSMYKKAKDMRLTITNFLL